MKRLNAFAAIAFVIAGLCFSGLSAKCAPGAVTVPCPPAPVERPDGNDALVRFKDDNGQWTFSLVTGQGQTLKNQVWSYPGKGAGANSPWGTWQGGDGTNSLTWSGPQTTGDFTVSVKATRSICPGMVISGDNDLKIESSWAGTVKEIVVKFTPTPIGICSVGGTSTVGVEITPAELANQVSFAIANPAIATIPPNSTAPNITVTGAAAGRTQIRALSANATVIAVANINVSDSEFDASQVTMKLVPPSDDSRRGLRGDPDLGGLTNVEAVHIQYSACLQNGSWKAILASISVDYSVQEGLVDRGLINVTGPNGAAPGRTTKDNYCAQVTDLRLSGYNPNGIARTWASADAALLHENLHVTNLKPNVERIIVPIIKDLLGLKSVANINGLTQQQAVNDLKAQVAQLETISVGLMQADVIQSNLDHYGPTGIPTPGFPGPALQVQFAAEKALADSICAYAKAQVPAWPACAACN